MDELTTAPTRTTSLTEQLIPIALEAARAERESWKAERDVFSDEIRRQERESSCGAAGYDVRDRRYEAIDQMLRLDRLIQHLEAFIKDGER